MLRIGQRGYFAALLALTSLGTAASSPAQLYINELYFDPPSSLDIRYEYVELRGTPGMALTNHYLLFIENEDNSGGTGTAGMIDNIFNLGSYSLGSNGFLTFLQKNHAYSTNAAATVLVNSGSGSGFGSGAGSSIGATDAPSGDEAILGQIENGGFTAMIIRNDSGPVPDVTMDLDIGNNGLDVPTGKVGWTILDAVGVHSDFDESDFGRLYAPVNFGLGAPLPGATPTPRIPEGAVYQEVGYEIEYIGRWGNSTGQTIADWHVSNLTENTGTGSTGAAPDFRQSGDPHALDDGDPTTPPVQPALVETNQGVLYGVPLTTTIGAPNFITGDYTKDGVVNAADYTVWRDTQGATGTNSAIPAADGNLDYAVTPADYDVWKSKFNTPNGPGAVAASTAVPEASTILLALLAIGGAVATRKLQ
jgi:hypothetical protein